MHDWQRLLLRLPRELRISSLGSRLLPPPPEQLGARVLLQQLLLLVRLWLVLAWHLLVLL
jgi:hypothetical protein